MAVLLQHGKMHYNTDIEQWVVVYEREGMYNEILIAPIVNINISYESYRHEGVSVMFYEDVGVGFAIIYHIDIISI
jgi:hypothetical protein